jgi:flagellar assembly factor FliW
MASAPGPTDTRRIVMKIRTASFGEVEATPESFLSLPDGLIGFEEHREFVLLELSDYAPFRWLLSYTDPGLSFPLLDPEALIPGYTIELVDVEREALELEDGEAPSVYVVATILEEGDQVTVNLRAPLMVNHRRQTARQVVLSDGRWDVQYPLLRPRDSRVAI